MSDKAKVKNFDQFQLRLPPGMRERLRDAAAQSDQSINAEIISRLEKSFVPSGNENLFANRDLYIWAIMIAREFGRAGSAAAQRSGEDPDRWMDAPGPMFEATYAAISTLVRDLVRLPNSSPEEIVVMLDQAKARVGTHLVNSGKASMVDLSSGKPVAGFIDPELGSKS